MKGDGSGWGRCAQEAFHGAVLIDCISKPCCSAQVQAAERERGQRLKGVMSPPDGHDAFSASEIGKLPHAAPSNAGSSTGPLF